MVLVDTSSWVQQLRRNGDPEVRERVESLLQAGEAAWCAIVRLELWSRVGGDRERKILREYQSVLPDLLIDDAVWKLAQAMADRARRNGITVPASDLLIFACSRHHQVDIEHKDKHFADLSGV
jgi:predicted nucleic acid-binding protein